MEPRLWSVAVSNAIALLIADVFSRRIIKRLTIIVERMGESRDGNLRSETFAHLAKDLQKSIQQFRL